MQLEFPYQIVTFLNDEPQPNEPVYYGKNGWYPQVALKRRFKTNNISGDDLIELLKNFFEVQKQMNIYTGKLVMTKSMPSRVVEIINQSDLKLLHATLLAYLADTVTSRYPEREGQNYYPHITAEYNNEYVFEYEKYENQEFTIDNIWILKDQDGENSIAYTKIK